MEKSEMIKNMSSRKEEIARRDAADAAFGSEVILNAQEVQGREIMQMLSVRMEPSLVAGLRAAAEDRNVKVSDLLREAATQIVDNYRRRVVQLSSLTFNNVSAIAPNISLSYGSGSDAAHYGATSTSAAS
jgi:hypothetical protein